MLNLYELRFRMHGDEGGTLSENTSKREYREKENHCSLELNVERYQEYNSGPEI